MFNDVVFPNQIVVDALANKAATAIKSKDYKEANRLFCETMDLKQQSTVILVALFILKTTSYGDYVLYLAHRYPGNNEDIGTIDGAVEEVARQINSNRVHRTKTISNV